MYKTHPIIKTINEELYDNIPSEYIGIRGKLYDLSNFEHPGGNIFIKINKGCDITALFETHHLNMDKAEKYLYKLPIVGEYKQKIIYNYSYYSIIRRIVYNFYPTIESRRMDILSKILLLNYILLTLVIHIKLLNIKEISINYIFVCIISSIFNSICGGYGHNGVHTLRFSSLLLDWNGLSCYEWLFEHIQSHHMYVNTKYDHDSISMKPFLNWIPSNKVSFFSSTGKHLIYLIAELSVSIQGNLIHKHRWSIFFNKEFPLFVRFAPMLFLVRILSHLYYQGIIFGIFTLVLNLIIAGYYFAYLAHLNHGNSDGEFYKNFIYHQLKNTYDIKTNYIFNQLLLNLDKQSMHHLFPTIDHCHLNYIKKILKKNINIQCKNINELNKIVNNTLVKYSYKLL